MPVVGSTSIAARARAIDDWPRSNGCASTSASATAATTPASDSARTRRVRRRVRSRSRAMPARRRRAEAASDASVCLGSWLLASGECGAEPAQRARDAQPRGGGSDVEAAGDLVVAELVDDAQLDGRALAFAEAGERGGQLRRGREAGVDVGEAALLAEVDRQAEADARAVLAPPLAQRVAQDVAADREQPRRGAARSRRRGTAGGARQAAAIVSAARSAAAASPAARANQPASGPA